MDVVTPVSPAAPSAGHQPAPDERRPPGSRFPWSRLASLLVLAAVAALVVVTFWPGHVDGDTPDAVMSAANGPATDWHSPILFEIWRPFYLLGLRSTGYPMAATVVTMLAGFYLLMRTRLSRPWSVGLAVALIAFPPVLSWSIHVGRDAWFTALTVCAFGLATRAWRTAGRSRRISVAMALVAAFLAQAARQDAFMVVFAVALAVAPLLLPSTMRWRRLAVAGIGVAATLGIVLVYGVVEAATGVRHSYPEQSLYVQDLATLSRAEGRVLFPPDIFPAQDLAYIRSHSTVSGSGELVWSPGAEVRFQVVKPLIDEERDAWIRAILDHPVTYLHSRAAMSARLFAVDAPAWLIVQPDQAALVRPMHDAAMNYILLFAIDRSPLQGGALYDPWIYLLIVAGGTAWLFSRRAPADRVLGVFGAAMLVYAVGLTVTVPEVDYRYSYPVVVTGAILVPLMAAALAGAVRTRYGRGRRAPGPDPYPAGP